MNKYKPPIDMNVLVSGEHGRICVAYRIGGNFFKIRSSARVIKPLAWMYLPRAYGGK